MMVKAKLAVGVAIGGKWMIWKISRARGSMNDIENFESTGVFVCALNIRDMKSFPSTPMRWVLLLLLINYYFFGEG